MHTPINHHYVPQTYLRRWEDENKKIWFYNAVDKTIAHRNKSSVLYEKHLYALTLREFSLLTPEQKEWFITPLKPYQVFLDNKLLTAGEIIENLMHFEAFVIKKSNGSVIKQKHKKALLDEILNKRYPLIEGEYGRIEDSWNSIVDYLEEYRRCFLSDRQIPVDDGGFINKLLEFILSMYTRNPHNMLQHLEGLKTNYNMDVDNRTARTAFEEMQLLFLRGERNLFDMSLFDIYLMFSTDGNAFLTSDCPVFIRIIGLGSDSYSIMICFPASPNIFVALFIKEPKKGAQVKAVIATKETVQECNRIIREYAAECFISSVDLGDKSFKYSYN